MTFLSNMGSALQNAGGFVFGPGTDAPTYESLKRKRDIADALMQQTLGSQPDNWGEGVGSLMNALAYRMIDRKLAPQEGDERKRIADLLMGTGEGYSGSVAGAAGGFTGAGVPDTPMLDTRRAPPSDGPDASLAMPVPRSTGAVGNAFADAIAKVESGGNYGALGPVTKSGDRAYGKYQVMGANIPSWSEAAIGQSLTPEQFLASPEAQDAVFNHRFGGYADKYGPEGAARAWFSGEGGMNNPNASDGYNTNDQYAAKFMDALGGGGLAGMIGQREPDMGRLAQLAEVAGNPYASDGQKLIAQLLVKRELDTGNAITPYQAAQLGLDQQRLQLDRDKFQQGTREGPKFYGNVQWADRTPDDGIDNPEPYQIGSDGQVSWVDLNGATPLPPTKNVNAGTEYVVQGPGGAQLGSIAIDNAGKAASTIAGETQGNAIAGLPDFEAGVAQASTLIDSIIGNPALPNAFGVLNSKLPTVRQDTANVEADVNQLKSQIFPMAIQALKGLGAMSNMEGDAMAQSIASLDFTRDPQAAIAELKRVKGVLDEKLSIARQKAGVPAPVAPPPAAGGIPQAAIDAGIDPALWPFLKPEEQALWSN